MKKMLLLVVMIVAIAFAITPAVAGQDHHQGPVVTYSLGASSGASVSSGSISVGHNHASGSIAGAGNTSSAYVKSNNDPTVTSGASSVGGTFTGGFGKHISIAGQEGAAFGVITMTNQD